MTAEDGKSRLLKTTVATMVVALLGLMIAPTLIRWNNRQFANRLAARLAEADDTAVKVPLRQLDSLGDEAIEPLMVAATSQRVSVAAIARQIVEEKLAVISAARGFSATDRLDDESIQTIEALAVALAKHIHDFGPAGQQWGEGIALAMIELTDKLPAYQTYVLLESCSDVLTAVQPRGPMQRSLTRQTAQPPQDLLSQLDSGGPPLEPLTRASEKSLEYLARIQPGSPPVRAPQAPPAEASTLIVEPQDSSLEWSRRTRSDTKPQQSPAGSLTKVTPNAVTKSPPTKSKAGVVDVPSPADMAAQTDSLRQLSNDELFLKLRQASFFHAGSIRKVLIERGLVEAEIELRLKLETPVETDRLRYIDEVSRLPTASARRTLRWLLEDQSGDVRLRALTALATTRHPEVVEIARELAVNDEDPRVANLASQLIR